MSQFYVVGESSEDTLGSADILPDVVRVAKEAARQGRAGELITVLDSDGQAVRQFVHLPDGTVAEQPIARRVNQSPDPSGFNGAEQVAAADRPRE